MRILLYSVLIVFCLISCKGKEEKKDTIDYTLINDRYKGGEGAGYLAVDSSGTITWDDIDTIPFIGDTYTFEGKYEHPVGRVPHTIPIKPTQGIVITKNLNMDNKPYDSITVDKNGDVTYHAKPHVFSGNIDTIPKKDTKPINFNIGPRFFRVEVRDSVYTILDSGEVMAERINGKWTIINAEMALEVHYKLDSMRYNEYFNKNKQ